MSTGLSDAHVESLLFTGYLVNTCSAFSHHLDLHFGYEILKSKYMTACVNALDRCSETPCEYTTHVHDVRVWLCCLHRTVLTKLNFMTPACHRRIFGPVTVLWLTSIAPVVITSSRIRPTSRLGYLSPFRSARTVHMLPCD